MKMRIAHPLLAMGAMLISWTTVLAQSPDSAKITTLLQNSEQHAARASSDAERIDSYTRSRTNWESHATQLNRMKENINALGKDIGELTAAREEASPWQQQAIDEINPLLRSMADHLTAMINHLNDNHSRIHMPEYQNYAKANYELSQKLSATIHDYVDYAEAKSRTEALEQKLMLSPENTSGEQ